MRQHRFVFQWRQGERIEMACLFGCRQRNTVSPDVWQPGHSHQDTTLSDREIDRGRSPFRHVPLCSVLRRRRNDFHFVLDPPARRNQIKLSVGNLGPPTCAKIRLLLLAVFPFRGGGPNVPRRRSFAREAQSFHHAHDCHCIPHVTAAWRNVAVG